MDSRKRIDMLGVIRLSLLVPASLLVAGCADGRAADAPGRSLPTWRVSDAPVRVIGSSDGAKAYQFDGIAGARRREDGGFVVADGGSKEIRIFDAEGRHLRTMGRAGGGPGEFEGIGRVFLLRGDSVAAWDPRQQRLTVFAGDGRVARTEALPLPGAAAPVEAILEDGTLVARAGIDFMSLMAAREGERRLPVTHLVRAPGTEEWREVGGFAGREELVYRSGGSVSFDGVLFGRDHVAAAGRRRWYTGDTDRFEITVRSPDGSTAGVLRRDHVPQPVTEAVLERARADRREQGEASRREMERRMGARAREVKEPELPHRPTIPAFDQVVEDAGENVWVRHYHFPADAPQRWSVFSPAGELIAEAETPAGLRVQQIGPDWILGIASDEMDVNSVQIYALVRP
jgi:hypothetical protein